jgi:uncharacterized cupredoxin-like copper-binding protein
MRPDSRGLARRLALLLAAFITMASFLVLACQTGGESVETAVEMREYMFQPNQITATAGQPFRLTLKNTGTVAHSFTVRDLDVSWPKLEPGRNAAVTFTPPQKGTFSMVCTEPGHEENGMVGTLTVR